MVYRRGAEAVEKALGRLLGRLVDSHLRDSAPAQPATMVPHKGAWRTAAKRPAVTPTETAATAGVTANLTVSLLASWPREKPGTWRAVEGDSLH